MATDTQYKNLPTLKLHKRKEGGEFTHTVIGNIEHGVYGGSYNVPRRSKHILRPILYLSIQTR